MTQPAVRAFALLELLQSRDESSGAALAAALGVDRRTLRRHVAALETMGIPVTTRLGRFGGYRLVPGFKLPPMLFTADEALALAVGLVAVRELGLASAMPALAAARAKLERVLPATTRARLAAVDETVTLELSRPAARLDAIVLARLATATQERRRLELEYRAPDGEQTGRRFDCYGLVYRAGRWYAVGHCHLRRGLRSFRLDRIVLATDTAERFERPAGFDALDHLKHSISTLPRRHAVEVLLATDLATAQRELFSAFGVLEWTGSGVLLRSQADDLDWFARELARLPFGFEVRAPAALRVAVAAAGRRLVRLAGGAPARTARNRRAGPAGVR